MNKKRIFICLIISLILAMCFYYITSGSISDDPRFVIYEVNCSEKEVKMYWKDDKQDIFKSIQHLKLFLDQRHQRLEFAMKGGMHKENKSPQGSYIEDHS